ncbi:cuticular protein analogous to peritrophins 3-A2 precursor [Anopheles sinensis]|uniref:Cuticular protein analogous to peritrophins 3-A2 n=1 Tax=Anopheles sinensis TaxID=74873 RepID=A0A084W7B2_ANOSI|nr:cuticular protein analogous to peritrophins 3-A2 precursor [Anopheles sinensis]
MAANGTGIGLIKPIPSKSWAYERCREFTNCYAANALENLARHELFASSRSAAREWKSDSEKLIKLPSRVALRKEKVLLEEIRIFPHHRFASDRGVDRENLCSHAVRYRATGKVNERAE